MAQTSNLNNMLKGRKLWISGGAACVLIVIGAAVFGGGPKPQKVQETMPLFTVKKERLDIKVTCPGSIVSRDVKILQSELEGRVTIISLVDDGATVKKGDLLVELDASKLTDSKVDQQINVQKCEAAWVQAREKLAVAENQAKADVEKASLDKDFSKQDLAKYRDGEFPNLLKAAESKISLAQQESERAKDKLKWSRILFADKYLSATELKADELAASKAQADVELATSERDLLRDFTFKREMSKLASDANQADMTLERTKRKSSADVIQAQSELDSKKAEFDQQKDKLAKIETQIAKAKIYAPIDGRAIYATSAKGTHWDEQPLAIGQDVTERQELIYLPMASSVKAEVKLHESNLQKVSEGLPAKVTADAMPGKPFWGTVASIAPLPDARSAFQNPDLKVYPTDIYIDGDVSELRIGWSCRAEIIVAQYPDTLQVPVQAVTKIDGKPHVYVLKGDALERREVKVGLDNGTMVKIDSGLAEGEQVALAPPLERSKATDQQVKVPDGVGRNGGGRQKVGAADSNSPGGAAAGQGQRRQRRPGGAGGSGGGDGQQAAPAAPTVPATPRG
jgi:HlyD family secretion protein